MPHDAFISYSTKDKVIADAVCAKLEERKIRCWIAPRDVPAGQDYASSIIRAIDQCNAFVLIWSAESNQSPHVLNEVNRAFNRGITVIPFRIEDVAPTESLEYYIGRTHWLDAMTPPLEKHIERLAETILSILQVPRGEGGAAMPPEGPEVVEAVSAPQADPRQAEASRPSPRKWLWIGVAAGGVLGVAALLFLSGILALPLASQPAASTAVPASATPAISPLVVEVVDDFESIDMENVWNVQDDTGTVVTCTLDHQAIRGGISSWRIRWQIVPDGYGYCLRFFPEFADWSRGRGISLWYMADRAAQPVFLWMHVGYSDPGTGYGVLFDTTEESTAGWVNLVIPFEEFSLLPWEENPSNEFNPAQLSSYGFTVIANSEPVNLIMRVDDVALLLP